MSLSLGILMEYLWMESARVTNVSDTSGSGGDIIIGKPTRFSLLSSPADLDLASSKSIFESTVLSQSSNSCAVDVGRNCRDANRRKRASTIPKTVKIQIFINSEIMIG
eukprot:959294_1